MRSRGSITPLAANGPPCPDEPRQSVPDVRVGLNRSLPGRFTRPVYSYRSLGPVSQPCGAVGVGRPVPADSITDRPRIGNLGSVEDYGILTPDYKRYHSFEGISWQIGSQVFRAALAVPGRKVNPGDWETPIIGMIRVTRAIYRGEHEPISLALRADIGFLWL